MTLHGAGQAITLFGEEQEMASYETHLEEVRSKCPDLDPEAQARLAELETRKEMRRLNGGPPRQSKVRPPSSNTDDGDEDTPRRSRYYRKQLAAQLEETRAMAAATREDLQREADRRIRIAAAEAKVRQLEADARAQAEEERRSDEEARRRAEEEARRRAEAEAERRRLTEEERLITDLTGFSKDPQRRRQIVRILLVAGADRKSLSNRACLDLLRHEMGISDVVPGNAIGRVLFGLDERGLVRRYWYDGSYTLTERGIALAKE